MLTRTVKSSSGIVPEQHTHTDRSPDTIAKEEYEIAKARIHAQLINQVNLNLVAQIPESRRRIDLKTMIERLIEIDGSVPYFVRHRIADELVDELLGLGPLEKLLADPTISDILINGSQEIFVDRRGCLELTEVKFRDDAHALQILDRIVSRVGRRIDESSPMVDARLQDGSRVNAVIPPLALKGPTICIRRFGTKALSMEDLLRFHALTAEMVMFLEAAVKGRLNIIISGGTGSGKTTLLNSLSRFIPDHERIVTIEDAAELQLQQRHVVPLETRPPNIEGKAAVSTRDLLRNSLRMRPDRIVVGECRSGEAFDMLQAMNTGHDGSMTTLHANSPRDAIARLETMILMAGFELPIKAMRQQCSSAVNLIIQANRLQGGVRRVTSVTEVVGMEGDTVVLQEIYHYKQLGVSPNGKAYGEFHATGVRPKVVEQLNSSNLHFPKNFFTERVLYRDKP